MRQITHLPWRMRLMTFYWTLAPRATRTPPQFVKNRCVAVSASLQRLAMKSLQVSPSMPAYWYVFGVPDSPSKSDLHQAGLGVVAGHVAHAPARSASEGGCDLAGSPGVGGVARRLAGRRTLSAGRLKGLDILDWGYTGVGPEGLLLT